MLYFVSTPIGNLKDITLRALDVLSSVDIIACEDTRTSMKLLNHYDIKTKLIAYHKFNERQSAKGIIDMLKEGKDIAVISDAGTPIISDPGSILVQELKKEALEYTVIPGANALLPALILSGLSSDRFTFIGFLPEKNSERNKLLDSVSTYETSLIFYISPHSLEKDIKDLENHFKGRKACLVKEITKLNEQTFSFVFGDEIDLQIKGEFVLIVEKAEKESLDLENMTVLEHFNFYINLGYDKNSSIKLVAKDRNVKKDVIYKEIINLNK